MATPGLVTGISVQTYGDTYLDIYWQPADNAVNYEVAFRATTESIANSFIVEGISFTSISGLTPNTAYIVNVRGISSDGEYGSYNGSENEGARTFRITKTDISKPGKWYEWNFQHGQKIQDKLTANTWNNFINRIMEVYDYRFIIMSYIPQVNQGDRITATIVNSVIDSLNILGAGLQTVAPGQKITADIFINMQSALNNIIDNL